MSRLIKECYTLHLTVFREADDRHAKKIHEEIMTCLRQGVSWAKWFDGVVSEDRIEHAQIYPATGGNQSSEEATK